MRLLSSLAPASPFDEPSIVYTLLTTPFALAARALHAILTYPKPHPRALGPPIRVVCMSDTHTDVHAVPDGDLLVHAGDLTNAGTVAELQAQIDWLNTLPHRHKVAIAGNHDTYLDPRSRATLAADDRAGRLGWGDVHYLQHELIELVFSEHAGRTLSVYGAPQLPACGGEEFAFQYPRGRDAWSDTIPDSIDILITHTPPKWHLDLPVGLGCEWLLKETWRIRPRLHVFGHVHAGSGSEVVSWNAGQAAYERICKRPGGLVSSFLNPLNWVDLTTVFLSDLKSLCWVLLWGGDERGGIMVNSALMSQKTGKLDNAPTVVLI